MSVETGVAVPGDEIEDVPVRAGSRATWGEAVTQWADYCREKEHEQLVFQAKEPPYEIMTAPYSHRWRDAYTKQQYAKIQSFVRGALDEYDDPHFVFLTRSSSTTTPTGEPRPPMDHLDELVDAWSDGVRYELYASMEADRKKDEYAGFGSGEWEYLRILEPTTDEGHVPGGFGHEHTALVVDGDPGEQRFHSVIEKHVEKCPEARLEAHEFDDTIEVRSADELNNPGAYLFKYLGKTWESAEMERYEERFAALLKETERRRFQPSDGAQRWMQIDEEDSEAGEWEFVGVADDERAEQLRPIEDIADFEARVGHDDVTAWLRGKEPVDLEEIVRERTSEERRPSDVLGYEEVLRDGEWVTVPEQHTKAPPPSPPPDRG